jgi:hypothetical protein
MSAIAVFQLIQAVVASAPKSLEAIKACRDFLAAMFKAGLVDRATQDALMLWMDGREALLSIGIIPDGWEVRPDPTTDMAG